MTTQYRYEFGRRWNARLPRNAIKYLVERYHCATDDDTIVGDLLDRLKQSKIPQSMWDACRRYALIVHHRQKDMYYRVLRGDMR
jgi:uncharacterized protein